MTNTARIRRDLIASRILPLSGIRGVGASRGRSGRLAHLACMNENMRPFPGLEPVLTTSELAAHLGVPVQTIHDLRHLGRGPHGFRVGRELRYRLSEVRDWLAQLEQAGEAARGQNTEEVGR